MSEVTMWQRNEKILGEPAEHWLEYYRELAYRETGEKGRVARLIFDYLQKKIDMGDICRKNLLRNL